MKKLHDIIQKNMETLEKHFPMEFWATENCFSNPTELEFIQWQDSQTKSANLHKENVKQFLLSSQLSIIQAIDEWAEESKCNVPEKPKSQNELTDDFVDESLKYVGRFNYNKALSDLRSFCLVRKYL